MGRLGISPPPAPYAPQAAASNKVKAKGLKVDRMIPPLKSIEINGPFPRSLT
ncbi:MAG TPA: hypothetical protein VFS13_10580 [Steroidobacteraceae bacterium]|jgi:hypothetical protein|nr:hypothetical protein [Steroidobacteraceae bacterium]